MRSDEFAKRLSLIPEVQPDEIDLAMLENAESVNDDTLISLERFNRELEERPRKSKLYRPSQPA